MYFNTLQSSTVGKLCVLVVLSLSLVSSAFSEPLDSSYHPYNFDITVQPNADEVGVFPFSGLGQWASCGYSRPTRLRIVSEQYGSYGRQFALFNGGRKMGGSYIAEFNRGTCDGLNGYATSKYVDIQRSLYPTTMSNTLTVQFTSPIPAKVGKIVIQGDISEEYEITLHYFTNPPVTKNYTSPQNSSAHRYLIDRVSLSDLGFSDEERTNVEKVTIKSLNPNWAFALHGIYYDFSEDDDGGGNNQPPDREDINPVIFVPGVAGSELFENENGTPKRRWINLLGLERLKLPINLPSDRDIYATDALWGQTLADLPLIPGFNFYTKLLQTLSGETRTGGNAGDAMIGKLYLVGGDNTKRTTNGCDLSQDLEDPNLKPRVFIFAYDWRQDNFDTAQALKDYVGCVKQFHPNKKINLVAHSMGGLVARRYILDNPNDHQIEKAITIATPWLGAPKGIHALETGAFIAPAFGSDKAKWALNLSVARKLKSVLETTPGPLQLLPSQQYFNLNGVDQNTESYPYPLSVRLSPFSIPQFYDYAETINWLNSRYEISPGTITERFHETDHNNLQDDWRQDVSGVEYHHIYGQQEAYNTIGRVDVTDWAFCRESTSLNCFNGSYFKPIPTNGDGTVPTISARRVALDRNINSSRAKRYFEDAKDGTALNDDVTEHTKLTANPRIINRVREILTDVEEGDMVPEDTDYETSLASTNSKKDSAKNLGFDEGKSFYISLRNVEGFHFDRGNFGSLVGISGPDGSQVVPMGEKSVWVATPAIDTYTLKFFGNGEPINLQIVRGIGHEDVTRLTKYVDVEIPANKVAELTVSAFYSSPELWYDADDDGYAETYVDETLIVEDENAKDLEAPVVSFDYQPNGGGKIITLSAMDNLSGVKSIYYSLDGQDFTEYTSPISVIGSQNEVYVFAEDNNYNRTGIAPIGLAGTSYSIGNRVWYDTNNDGKIDNDLFLQEQGISGVSVSLFADTNSDGQPDDLANPLKTTKTTGNGYYRFDELNTGNYVVRINPENFVDNEVLAGYLNSSIQTSNNTDSDNSLAGENGILPSGQANQVQNVGVLSNSINLGPNISEPLNETDTTGGDKGQFDGYADLTVDFGFYQSRIGGSIWSDNGQGQDADNGIFDDNEIGIANFRVKIFQANGDEISVGNDGILGTSDDGLGGVLTDASGNYLFKGLQEEDYVVKVLRINVISSSVVSNGADDNIDFDNNGIVGSGSDSQYIVSSPLTITLADRGLLENNLVNEFLGVSENPTLDFGLLLSPTAALVSVQGRVLNSAGRFVSGARVTLTNTATNEAKTTLTNSFGNFKFDELPVGETYIITVHHKQYSFLPQAIQLVEDIRDLVILAQ